MSQMLSTPSSKLSNSKNSDNVRRIFDIIGATIGLILLSPVFVLISLWIKFDSTGPVFYRAKRIGRSGKPFLLYKFRSMVTDADRRGPGITTASDQRITGVGHILRRTKLDELPQLLNVLLGDMSLVGPRPEDPRYVALYTSAQRQVLNCRPGITSAASLVYRHEEQLLLGPNWETVYRNEVMPAKLALDLDYLAQRTLLSDFNLIIDTLWSIFKSSTYPYYVLTGLRMRYLILIDLICICVALLISFVIRYEALVNVWPYLQENWIIFILAPLVRLPIYYAFRLYNRLWRYASTAELRMILLAGLFSSFIIYISNFELFPLLGLPNCPSRSVWALEGVLSLSFLGGTRFLLRILQERMHPRDLARLRKLVQTPSKVLIVGAGDSGAVILHEIQTNLGLGLKVIGMVDDDPAKLNMRVHGVPVLGNRHAIPSIVKNFDIDQLIIAMPTASGKEIREIVNVCEQVGIQPRMIPGIYELLDGTVTLSQLREIQIEDLLRREPVQTDIAAVGELLKGKRVLVTGGGGSIGSELCRQILRCQPASLILIGHGENSIFEIHNELLNEINKTQRIKNALSGTTSVPQTSPALRAIIADIRSLERIQSIIQETRPEIIFHAAAHKHVPLMEHNPAEAITNNVLGTRNLLQAALAGNVERFVMISTDKAVNPTSIMGASKRVAELLVHEAARKSDKSYVAVRFGNVLGSRGSVVHTFKQQIKAGGPITVTDPEMKRYFMTIPEAVQLVLQASVLGRGGEVFLLDMGEPIKIIDLARDIVELSGLEVGRDIDIEFTGLRPGEKLFEELFVSGEDYQRTRHEKIFIAANASSFVPERIQEAIDALAWAAHHDDKEAIVRGLQNLVPEFQPPQPYMPNEEIKQKLVARPALKTVPN